MSPEQTTLHGEERQRFVALIADFSSMFINLTDGEVGCKIENN